MKKTCKTCRGKKPGYRCWFCDEANAAQNTQSPEGWPMKSTALAVHPSQAKEATEDAKKVGVPTEFTRSGRPVFTTPAHRKAYMKAYGFFDKNAGYGDYSGPSRETERQGMAREQREEQFRYG